jgi:hypothetical protein
MLAALDPPPSYEMQQNHYERPTKARGTRSSCLPAHQQTLHSLVHCRKRLGGLVKCYVMTTHGPPGLTHVPFGSAAETDLRDAPCPLLTGRAEARLTHSCGEQIIFREWYPGFRTSTQRAAA